MKRIDPQRASNAEDPVPGVSWFGQSEYERLAHLSVAHLYNLRKTGAYRKRRVVYQGIRPTAVSIGERRKPDPQGRLEIGPASLRRVRAHGYSRK